MVDKKQGNILAQGDDQTEPNLLTNLTLSTVRECDIEETDRNFCFQVRSLFPCHAYSPVYNSYHYLDVHYLDVTP